SSTTSNFHFTGEISNGRQPISNIAGTFLKRMLLFSVTSVSSAPSAPSVSSAPSAPSAPSVSPALNIPHLQRLPSSGSSSKMGHCSSNFSALADRSPQLHLPHLLACAAIAFVIRGIACRLQPNQISRMLVGNRS
ncbi:hypothetical protein AOQ84DRAFT_355540, partial [Glonium stellatum]